jgi:hypothetical protein
VHAINAQQLFIAYALYRHEYWTSWLVNTASLAIYGPNLAILIFKKLQKLNILLSLQYGMNQVLCTVLYYSPAAYNIVEKSAMKGIVCRDRSG